MRRWFESGVQALLGISIMQTNLRVVRPLPYGGIEEYGSWIIGIGDTKRFDKIKEEFFRLRAAEPMNKWRMETRGTSNNWTEMTCSKESSSQ